MVFTNALNFVLHSNDFQDHISENRLNPNAVNSLLIKYFNTVEHGHVYKFTFDYGIEGPSNKDLTLKVKVLDGNSFEII
jgi:hypothetical protein